MSNEPAIELKDVIHLYLGCECDFFIKLPEGFTAIGERMEVNVRVLHNVLTGLATCKPILRKLDSMTGEEQKELDATKFFQRATPVHVIGSMVWTAESFRWALSNHFDLFNLIENNLAIDKNEKQ